MKETRIFQIQIGNEEQLATKNMVKGTKTQKEKIVIVNNEEFLKVSLQRQLEMVFKFFQLLKIQK
jgi:non-homologous end joining protein Ku